MTNTETVGADRDRLIHILVVHFDMFRNKAEEAADLFLHAAALRQPDTRMEGGGELVMPETSKRAIGMIAHIDHGKTSITAAVSRIMAEKQSAAPSSPTVGELAAHAIRQLQWHDERTQKVHDIIEDLREIILEMPAEQRPEGLFKKAQDAVYGMRGRIRLMDDMAIVTPLSSAQSSIQRLTEANEALMRERTSLIETKREQIDQLTASIQRAERERDEAIDRAKVREHYWQQEVKAKGEVISWCKDYQTRIAALEAQLAEARKVLSKAMDFRDSDYVPNTLFDRIAAFLASLREKQDAE